MNLETIKKNFLLKYVKDGEEKFHRYLMFYALNNLMLIKNGKYRGQSPELEFLDYHDQFIILYRREGDSVYCDLAKVFRKVAHKIYRIMLKKDLTSRNAKFLNLV
jgi:hypothetical protein